MSSRNTYRYQLKVGDRVVYFGFTTDLQRREQEHRGRWPNATIEPVGEPTSHREAWEWAVPIPDLSILDRNRMTLTN